MVHLPQDIQKCAICQNSVNMSLNWVQWLEQHLIIIIWDDVGVEAAWTRSLNRLLCNEILKFMDTRSSVGHPYVCSCVQLDVFDILALVPKELYVFISSHLSCAQR